MVRSLLSSWLSGQPLAWAPPSIAYDAVSNRQVNGGCAGTCTAVGAACTAPLALVAPPLLPPISVNTSCPWALPGMTYVPAAPTLPPSSVRKQLNMFLAFVTSVPQLRLHHS